jgi:tetratricopeptide (TPR) repeat protein
MAEIEMNLGLVLQSLASANAAPITGAIAAYQRALRTFDAKAFPKEYAILQNNLATAFLSIPFSDERAKMREALAVQAFQEGLKVVNLIDHPSEYAMLQNNLGNALQYVSSSHSVENCLRALDAYDEALKVRSRATTPAEYANTIANYANCLRNLPDDVAQPELGNRMNLGKALHHYREAVEIFSAFGDVQKVGIVSEMIAEIEGELTQAGFADAPGATVLSVQ